MPDTDNNLAASHRYDRLVHFSFGLLLAYPMREVFLRISQVKGFWGFYLPLDVTLSFFSIPRGDRPLGELKLHEWLRRKTPAQSGKRF